MEEKKARGISAVLFFIFLDDVLAEIFQFPFGFGREVVIVGIRGKRKRTGRGGDVRAA